MENLLAHLVGDYVLQSDWAANNKQQRWLPAIAHALTYGLCFLVLMLVTGTVSVPALLVITLTHLAIDHWRLARYVVHAKNFLAPRKTVETKVVVFEKDKEGDAIIPPNVEPLHEIADVNGFLKAEARVTTQWWYDWKDCAGTGYHKDRPVWMSVWLLIIADNTLHLILNELAIRYL
jgi:hypothetical protein